MAGFVDVLLRGLILVLTSVALGGVAWLRFVLRAEPHVKPDAPTALALRTLAAAATGAALAQAAVVLVGLTAVAGHASPPFDVGGVMKRFSTLAFRSMAAIVLAGVALTLAYVGDLAAFVGTAYGVMVLSKVALLVPALALAWLNMRAVRRAAEVPGTRLFSLVEIELGLGITILFAAASLTSLPPAVDVTTDRATVAEVAARFAPAAPRLTSPPIDELLRAADPLMGRQVERPWGSVFPLLCAAGGGLLLTHSHAMFNLKDEFLSEVTHAPLGILGAFSGWGRWLELRLPAAGRAPGWTWRGCFTAVGLILLFYREG